MSRMKNANPYKGGCGFRSFPVYPVHPVHRCLGWILILKILLILNISVKRFSAVKAGCEA